MRPSQVKLSLFAPVIQQDVEAAGHRDDQLRQLAMGMPTTVRAGRNVIQIVRTAYIEGYVTSALDKGQIATLIMYLRFSLSILLVVYGLYKTSFA